MEKKVNENIKEVHDEIAEISREGYDFESFQYNFGQKRE
jgi:hypothetical protein